MCPNTNGAVVLPKSVTEGVDHLPESVAEDVALPRSLTGEIETLKRMAEEEIRFQESDEIENNGSDHYVQEDRTPRGSYCFGRPRDFGIRDELYPLQIRHEENGQVSRSNDETDERDIRKSNEDIDRTPRNSFFGHLFGFERAQNCSSDTDEMVWNDRLFVQLLNKFQSGDCRSNSI